MVFQLRFERGIARADFVFHAGGFKAIKVGVLNSQDRVLRAAAVVTRNRVADALIYPRHHRGPIGVRCLFAGRRIILGRRLRAYRLTVTRGRQARQYVFDILQQRRDLIGNVIEAVGLRGQRGERGKLLVDGGRVFCTSVLAHRHFHFGVFKSLEVRLLDALAGDSVLARLIGVYRLGQQIIDGAETVLPIDGDIGTGQCRMLLFRHQLVPAVQHRRHLAQRRLQPGDFGLHLAHRFTVANHLTDFTERALHFIAFIGGDINAYRPLKVLKDLEIGHLYFAARCFGVADRAPPFYQGAARYLQ